MTVSASTAKYVYTGDGVSVAFPFPSLVLASGDILVGLNGVQQTTGYTVSGVNAPGGATVTFAVAPAAGATVLLLRKPTFQQLIDFVTAQTVLEGTVETALDRLTMMCQYLLDAVTRSLRVPDLDTSTSTEDLQLPPAAVRANKFLGFDGAGVPGVFDWAGNIDAGAVLDAIAEFETQLAALVLEVAGKVNTSDYSDEDVLAKVKNVDGLGSGLDADTLRGATPSATALSFLAAANAAAMRIVIGANSASNIDAGTLADGRLSANVALRNSGNLWSANQTILKAWAALILDRPDATTGAVFASAVAGAIRWQQGEDAAGNWFLQRFLAGVYAGQPMTVDRNTGIVTLGEGLAASTKFKKEGGAEGGQLLLEKPDASDLGGDVVFDVITNRVRMLTGPDGGIEHDFKAWAPAIHKIRHTGDGGFRSLLEWIPGQHHTNILNGAYTGSIQTWADSAFDSGENIELPKGGYGKLTDRLDPIKQGQVIRAHSDAPIPGQPSGGFYFYVDQDFNLAAPHVLATVSWSRYENVVVFGYQPPGATTKAACVQYPWAFSMRGGQRSRLINCGAFAMWNGVDARGVDLVNHPGGAAVQGFRDGCLNVGGQVDNLYDFFRCDDFESWVFGQNANQQQISYNETVYSLILGATVESFCGGKITQWNRTFNCNSDSLFTKTIDQLKLDGGASKLELSGADTVIGILEVLCDTNLVRQIVEVNGGNHEIGALHLRTINQQLAAIIRVAAGHLRLPGTIRAPGNAWVLDVTGGHADISHVNLDCPATARTLPAFKQTGASGAITALGSRMANPGSTGDLFAIEGTGSRIAFCDFKGTKLNAVTSLNNIFGPNLNEGNHF